MFARRAQHRRPAIQVLDAVLAEPAQHLVDGMPCLVRVGILVVVPDPRLRRVVATGAGSEVEVGSAHADNLFGIHLTSSPRPTPELGSGSKPVTEAEQALIDKREQWFRDEGGYNHIQGTKPQTLAYGLNDSPAGLASWIVEKYRTWSDCGGDVEKSYTKDELLTIVTIYWVTQTISSSTRMYYENQKHLWTMERNQNVPAPAGMAMFPQEISKPPREWGERSYDVRRWTEMPRGGHFAALEEPQLLAEEVRAFFRQFRKS